MRWLWIVISLLFLGSIAQVGSTDTTVVQAPVLKWQRGGCFASWCQTGWYASPAVADVDNDGQMEVIWASYQVFSLNGATGALEWSVHTGHDRAYTGSSNVGRTWPGVVVADIDNDGSLDIVTAHGGGWVGAYTGAGYFKSGWPAQAFTSELRSLAVTDLDGDRSLEIIVAKASGGRPMWTVLEHNGIVRTGWPMLTANAPGYAAGAYNENIGVADLDGDGRGEIIGPSDVHYISAFEDNGAQTPANAVYGANKVWSQVGVHVDHNVDLRGYANCGTEHRPNFADSAPTLADVDGNGTLEIIVVGNVYNCGTSPYTSLYHAPFLFNRDRTRWSNSQFNWTVIPGPNAAPLAEDYNVIETALPNPVAADLDGDGQLEILYPSYDGKLHAVWLDKTAHGSWPYSVLQAGEGLPRFASEPAVVDLDGDGRAEVIFGSWPRKGGNRVGKLHILNYLGQPLHEVNLPAPLSGDWNGALGAPTIANIDGDADLEVVLGTVGSGVVAYDLPGTANGRLVWPTGRGSYERTGAVCTLPDFDNDRQVTTIDITLITNAWRTQPTGATARFDLNRDGAINMLDVMRVTAAWGRRC